MTHGVPEGFCGLPGKRAPGGIGNRAGDHHRQAAAKILKQLFKRIDSGFSIECVKDSFDHDEIGTTFDQRISGFVVVFPQPIKRHVTFCGVVNVWRE